MTPRNHRLDIDGDPWDGRWLCTRCGLTFAYAVDGRGPCGKQRSFPWDATRVARFKAAVRRPSARAAIPTGRGGPVEMAPRAEG